MRTDGPRRSPDGASGTSVPIPVDARAGLDRVWPAVFPELRRIARRRLAAERTGHTLSTTALVHEVYLRLLDERTLAWEDRGAFFAQAARAMRRILVDYARRHRAQRRGGGAVRLSLDSLDDTNGGSAPMQIAVVEQAEELLALHEALAALARIDERAARVVECRFFGGLSEEETAAALGVTQRTVARDWVKARMLLRRALSA